jgi:hydroxyacylglutathione hydrolase
MPIVVRQFACFQDNYGYLIQDEATGVVAAIDTPEPQRIEAALAKDGWALDLILNTHHHWDHAGGNLALKERHGATVIGPAGEEDKIPGLDRPVRDGDEVRVGDSIARVIETPGHTLGHIVYYFEEDGIAFVGDTLFALGCGRLFEGTPQQMWASLSHLAALPPETVIYCAHEYTEANARFALSLGEDNPTLAVRAEEIFEKRKRGEPTVPTTISLELATNPFLRANAPSLRAALNLSEAAASDVFAEVRRRKDFF